MVIPPHRSKTLEDLHDRHPGMVSHEGIGSKLFVVA